MRNDIIEFQQEPKKDLQLNKIYWVKEAIHKFYRLKGRKWAAKSIASLTYTLTFSKITELKNLQKTLMK